MHLPKGGMARMDLRSFQIIATTTAIDRKATVAEVIAGTSQTSNFTKFSEESGRATPVVLICLFFMYSVRGNIFNICKINAPQSLIMLNSNIPIYKNNTRNKKIVKHPQWKGIGEILEAIPENHI